MSAVHVSQGPLEPASPQLRSEVDIICSLALATLGDRHDLPWEGFRSDYSEIRKRISRVVKGCESYEEKIDQPGGFTMPHPPRDSRTFPTEKDRAIFTVSPTSVLDIPEGHLLLQTLRSHDQFNTTIYGLEDRYRGISGGRRVVFVHPDDIAAFGFEDGSMVDLVSVDEEGTTRQAPKLPGRRLRPAAGLRRGVLPGDQPARSPGLHRRGQQPAGVEVGRDQAREGRRRPPGRARRERRRHRHAGGSRRRDQAARRARPPQLRLPASTGPAR